MNNKTPKNVFIVIPVHNRKALTQECLLSLQKQTFQCFETIIVDDGSTDGTAEMIKKEFPGVVLLQGDGYLWWTGAINKGIDYALQKGTLQDIVLTLNNDLLTREDYITSLKEMHYKHPFALIGSLNVDIRDRSTIHDGGVLLNKWTAKYMIANKNKKLNSIEIKQIELLPVNVLSGRGTLIPFTVLMKIGLFDSKNFPHYFADYEFANRAALNGYPLFISYNSPVFSHVQATGLGNEKPTLTEYFTSMKSPGNFPQRFSFGLKISRNPLMVASYLFFDVIRNALHYYKN